ncbi:MAG: helix-turn-helix transcriptional regulator [Bacteroidales bacterium]|nr:helix-turn-helix transcriptional regulator [Bacteroidales bacterium]
MDENISRRIREIMENSNLSASAFAAEIGITRSNLAHIFSGRNQPSFTMLEKILKAFPNVRTEWLVTGVGDMLKSPDEIALAEEVSSRRKGPVQTELSFDGIPDIVAGIGGPSPAAPLPDPTPATIAVDNSTGGAVKEDTPSQSWEKSENTGNQPVSARPVRSPGRPRTNTATSHVAGRKVRKIVYFYTDNTFEEFLPTTM